MKRLGRGERERDGREGGRISEERERERERGGGGEGKCELAGLAVSIVHVSIVYL